MTSLCCDPHSQLLSLRQPLSFTFLFLVEHNCGSSPCQNNATCVDEIDGFTCHCTDQWLGDTCTGISVVNNSLYDTQALSFITPNK